MRKPKKEGRSVDATGCSETIIRREIKARKLRVVKVGKRRMFIPADERERYLSTGRAT